MALPDKTSTPVITDEQISVNPVEGATIYKLYAVKPEYHAAVDYYEVADFLADVGQVGGDSGGVD